MGKYLVIAALEVAGLFIFGFGGISRLWGLKLQLSWVSG